MSVTNDGEIDVIGSFLNATSTSTITRSGHVIIGGGGTADFQDAFDQNVTFEAPRGTLALSDPADFQRTSPACSMATHRSEQHCPIDIAW